MFSRIAKELTVAAKMGGGDPNFNPRLRAAISAAKGANMPNANIDRAVSKGAGDDGSVNYEELWYEGYGPNGAALMVEILTDNRNRTAGEIRHIFSKRGFALAEVGAVGWKFTRKGQMLIEAADGLNEDAVMEAALEAGAEDVIGQDGGWEVLTDPSDLYAVHDALAEAGFTPSEVKLAMVPNATIDLTGDSAEKMLKLVEALEEQDDVQNVFSDYSIDDAELERLNA